jgi:hypothetical protein
MDCFIRQSPEDLSIPNVPKGYSFLVRMEGDATFACELLCANDIILRFVYLEVGQSESEDGDHTKWSYVFEQFWKLANECLLVPMFFSNVQFRVDYLQIGPVCSCGATLYFVDSSTRYTPHLMFVVCGCSRMKAETTLGTRIDSRVDKLLETWLPLAPNQR